MIRGYPARPSAVPGERVVLHIATDAPRFRIRFWRWGDGPALVHESEWLPGKNAEERAPDVDWHWPSYECEIGSAWPSGVYIAQFVETESEPFRLWSDCGAALFVVRGAGRAPILYKLPIATYHAYNCTGGGCFYFQPPRSEEPPGARLSWHRPGGGIGGEVFGAPDFYGGSSPRQTFAHWDAPFIRWLTQRGYEVDFCADLDLHEDSSFLARHRLLLSVGHDEYWTDAMRDTVERYVEGGGNAAFFAANVCWWRIHLVDGNSAMVCHQGGPQGARDHWWPASGVHRPEDALSGVSYRHGGGWWDGPRTVCPFVVQDGTHWMFEGTGLRTGDRFGADTTPPLAGYECDGVGLDAIDTGTGRAHLAASGRFGTPRNFVPLAVAELGREWQELPHREGIESWSGVHSATLGLHRPGGWVFTAGTTDWAQVLAGGEPLVERITRNVLDRLLVS